MTPDSYFSSQVGQSLLYPGQAEVYRGQCVQSVMLWIRAQGFVPPVYPSAYLYYQNGVPGYAEIPAGQPIQQGDIVVWGANYPPSSGNGHIDVAAADGTISDFWAYDSNWTPLVLEKIHHNGSDNNYISGYLRKEGNNNMLSEDDVRWGYLAVTGAQPTAAQLSYWVGRDKGEFLLALYHLGDDYVLALQKQVKALQAGLNKDSVESYINSHLS